MWPKNDKSRKMTNIKNVSIGHTIVETRRYLARFVNGILRFLKVTVK